MSNIMNFDTDDAEILDVDFDKPLPAGPYPALIQRVETKPTKDGTGTRVNIQHKVTEGEHKGRVFFAGLNVVNKNPQAQAISRAQLKKLLHAVGMPGEKDLSQLVGCEVIARLKVKPARGDFPAGNDVADYKPIGNAPKTPTTGKKPPAFMGG